MKYTIYKITNNINGKYYIGKHQTVDLNDNYMGSGKLLKRAIQKYGIENFSKEILHVFDTEEEMNLKEKELVVVSEETYNLCDGGKGGFNYINKILTLEERSKRGKVGRLKANQIILEKYGVSNFSQTLAGKLALRNSMISRHKAGEVRIKHKINPYNWLGKKHTEKTKQQMTVSHKGNRNSQFGTCWITNGTDNKKIKKELLAEWMNKGYRQGRMLQKT